MPNFALRRQYLIENIKDINAVVGICFPKSDMAAVLAKCVLDSKNVIAWIKPRSNVKEDELNDQTYEDYLFYKCIKLKVKYLIIQISSAKVLDAELLDKDYYCELYRIKCNDNLYNFGPEFLYVAETSGSTGKPKTVLVTRDSVMSNVNYFRSTCFGKIYFLTDLMIVNLYKLMNNFYSDLMKVNEESRIFWSTTLGFDPCMIEFLLWYTCKCELYLMEDEQKVLIKDILIASQPLFFQVTPAVLNLFDDYFMKDLFSTQDIVQYILIGGDTFPVGVVKQFWREDGPRMFNLYGITEMSVWASCTEFHPDVDTVADCSNALPDTSLEFTSNGVVIKSETRVCIVNNVRTLYHQTSDHFQEVTVDGVQKYVITGRAKIRGEAISREVEEYALSHSNIERARMVVFKEMIFLFLVSDDPAIPLNLEGYKVRQTYYLEELPLTVNGKVDDLELLKFIQEDNSLEETDIHEVLEYHQSLDESRAHPFWTLGFNSQQIFQFVSAMNIKYGEDMVELQKMLYDSATTLGDIMKLIFERPPPQLVRTFEEASYDCELLWQSPLRRCVDSTPVLYKNQIIAVDMAGIIKSTCADGSMFWEYRERGSLLISPLIVGGMIIYGTTNGLLVIRRINGKKLHERKLENPLSSTCVYHKGYFYFVCYTAKVFKLHVQTGNIATFINLGHNLKIRNPPVFVAGLVLVLPYGGPLYCFKDNDDETLLWTTPINRDTMLPIQICEIQRRKACIVFNLTGEICLIDLANGVMRDSHSTNTSFSMSACLCPDALYIIGGNNHLFKVSVGIKDRRLVLNIVDEEIRGVKAISGLTYNKQLDLLLFKSVMHNQQYAIICAERRGNHVQILQRLHFPSFNNILTFGNMIVIGTRVDDVKAYQISPLKPPKKRVKYSENTGNNLTG
ncbi:unnamed protein product [Bursaphelenchus okinawaensis]|uniref:AMP-binding domain-containing protein n=1 Tax=Bursaphelenchus okinawaensis TaxID=465554 RepID=A0A811KTY1_9BILA|nr:unnamed protein product [Bursaphelenchus okinawaensis]CAG9113184.1 unnamed protein product [Bursaphelenchus okinawaensis]